MLILNRKPGESIVINEKIEIKILEYMDGRMKIGIEAPENVTILRKEVYDAVKEQNQVSLSVNEDAFNQLRIKN